MVEVEPSICLHRNGGVVVCDAVSEVDAELSQAALGCRIISENVGERRVAEGLRETLAKGITSFLVIAESIYSEMSRSWNNWAIPKETTNNVFQKSNCLALNELGNHVAEHSAYRVEAFVGSTDVFQTSVI